MTHIVRRYHWYLGIMTLLASCSSEVSNQPAAARSDRERDSMIANSRLPGAAGVKKALELSDTLTSRAQQLPDKDPP